MISDSIQYVHVGSDDIAQPTNSNALLSFTPDVISGCWSCCVLKCLVLQAADDVTSPTRWCQAQNMVKCMVEAQVNAGAAVLNELNRDVTVVTTWMMESMAMLVQVGAVAQCRDVWGRCACVLVDMQG